VRKEDLCLVPDKYRRRESAGIPVAYLTAQVALPGLVFGRQVCSGTGDRRIDRQCRDAVVRAPWVPNTPMSSTTNHAKAKQAKELGSMRSSIPPWRSC